MNTPLTPHWPASVGRQAQDLASPTDLESLDAQEAERILMGLASVFLQDPNLDAAAEAERDSSVPNPEIRYKALLEQIPAIVYMAYLDRGFGEAYISPQIEDTVGFTREEWLEDPIRWYNQIHPDDQQRWSVEVAQTLLTGEPLQSAYRIISRDGNIVWFHCEAKMIRREDGRPWFVHGVAFDITNLKQVERELEQERNVIQGILDTVGALVVVLDAEGRIVRVNRAVEMASGYSPAELQGKPAWDHLVGSKDAKRFREVIQGLAHGQREKDYESVLVTAQGDRRLISWTCTALGEGRETAGYIILTGIDITERKELEKEVLAASSREQRRIGADLHDGLGQDLTGIAFLSKVLSQKLAAKSLSEGAEAAKIVGMVNKAIQRTRELGRCLLPSLSAADGLMAALEGLAREVEDLYNVSCRFECQSTVLVEDASVSTHLYQVAQEAVNNAIKHGRPSQVLIRLTSDGDEGMLEVVDNGSGFDPGAAQGEGMGLHIMDYRAGMVGGTLEIQRLAQGSSVCCRFPLGTAD